MSKSEEDNNNNEDNNDNNNNIENENDNENENENENNEDEEEENIENIEEPQLKEDEKQVLLKKLNDEYELIKKNKKIYKSRNEILDQ
jgi:hypothetical protein